MCDIESLQVSITEFERQLYFYNVCTVVNVQYTLRPLSLFIIRLIGLLSTYMLESPELVTITNDIIGSDQRYINTGI
jgi:hypothetical protein